jgi:hypothetical protein
MRRIIVEYLSHFEQLSSRSSVSPIGRSASRQINTCHECWPFAEARRRRRIEAGVRHHYALRRSSLSLSSSTASAPSPHSDTLTGVSVAELERLQLAHDMVF